MWSTSLPVSNNSRNDFGNHLGNSDFLRRYARRLLRDARSFESSKSLPVLRRIIAMKVMPELRVTDLYSVRTTIQRNYILHTLAKELGYAAWELCKQDIDACDTAKRDRYRLELGMFGDFQQNWFSNKATALDWQKENGGYLIAYGSQTVAILA